MEINLSRKQSKAWNFLEDGITTELFYGGAAGGGKSMLGCTWQIYRRVKYPETRGLIGRNSVSDLTKSTLITFFETAKKMGYQMGYDFKYNSQTHIVTWRNGSQNVLTELFQYPSDPDFNSLGSTEFTDAFIDESPEITLKAFEIVNSRLRWKIHDYGLVPTTLITGNPGPSWVKERYVITKDGVIPELKNYQQFVQATVDDNPDEAFRELYKSQLMKLTSDYDRNRLLYGDWDVEPENENPFFNQFNRAIHVSSDVSFDPRKQLLISMDFNLNPFAVIFSHMWQDGDGLHLHVIDEAEISHGSIPVMVELIKTKYLNSLPNCRITGDSMGKRGSIEQQDNSSLYTQLVRGLPTVKDNQLILPNNPTHENSRADCNYFLANFPDFKISSKCTGLIADMSNVKCDAFGSIIKKNRKDLSQRSDFGDGFRYLINTFLYKWIQDHSKGLHRKK